MSKCSKSINCVIPIGSTFLAYAKSSAIEKMGGRMIYSSYDQAERTKASVCDRKSRKSTQKTRKVSQHRQQEDREQQETRGRVESWLLPLQAWLICSRPFRLMRKEGQRPLNSRTPLFTKLPKILLASISLNQFHKMHCPQMAQIKDMINHKDTKDTKEGNCL